MMLQKISAHETRGTDDHEYDAFLERLQARFVEIASNEPLFTTDAEGLFEIYLNNLPEDRRQYHNCHCCRSFFNRFAGLVAITDSGVAVSPLWGVGGSPEISDAIQAVHRKVLKAKVIGVFYSSDKVWGQHVTGAWHHIAVTPPKALVFNHAIKTAFQASAEKREDRANVLRALAEFKPHHIDTAITLLKTDSLYRSEKCLGQAEFLKQLHDVRNFTRNSTTQNNLIWRMIAFAPAGFCHPRNSMISALLDDIVSGMDFNDVKRRFDSKMNPTIYQRPQSAPSAGNIAQAEKIIAKSGVAESLKRRFARIEEIKTIWLPKKIEEESKSNGVFGHLKPKGAAQKTKINIPVTAITWDKFNRTVLPTAERIEFLVPIGSANYCAFVTAENPDAPPILQWDSVEERNPFSIYVYTSGSSAANWGLIAGKFFDVTGVAFQPSMWVKGSFTHQGESVIFIIKGARDSGSKTNGSGNALFPEILRSEFHEIRSTIEAYSRNEKLSGYEESSACGIRLVKNETNSSVFRVTVGNTKLSYKIDRWD